MADSTDARERFVALPSGDALSAEEANQTTRSSVARVIVPVGLAGVGKTTLLSEIYERFRAGPFAGHLFAWSRTLHGFEQRAHNARIASRRSVPTTPRTPIGDSEAFLHLRLTPEDGLLPARDVLIADWPGEVFREMRDDVETAKSHLLLPRADHIAFLVDGESLGKLESRQEAYHEADMLIQSILDAGVDSAAKSVIFTKWDAALEGSGADALEDFTKTLEQQLRSKHEARSGELRFIRTAARPVPGSGLDRGQNLDEVLRVWIDSARGPAVCPEIRDAQVVREFDRFRSTSRRGAR